MGTVTHDRYGSGVFFFNVSVSEVPYCALPWFLLVYGTVLIAAIVRSSFDIGITLVARKLDAELKPSFSNATFET